ncbi:MAG: small multi-drug export protein [Clostridiales bacterium]|nr:small multi-drug export protein [Clostridiales bacterium]
MAETLAQTLVDFFGNKIPGELTIFLISLLPILELRGGLIAAVLLKIPLWKAFIICYISNMIPVPFIILFIKKIFNWMKKYKVFAKFVEKLEAKTEKNRDKVMRYKQWGLLLFVAIPLPGTGAWTGSLFAALLDIDIKKAIPIIALGVLIAGVIVSIVSYGAAALFGGDTVTEAATGLIRLIGTAI